MAKLFEFAQFICSHYAFESPCVFRKRTEAEDFMHRRYGNKPCGQHLIVVRDHLGLYWIVKEHITESREVKV